MTWLNVSLISCSVTYLQLCTTGNVNSLDDNVETQWGDVIFPPSAEGTETLLDTDN